MSDIIDAPASENCEKEEGVMWKDTRNCCIFMWVVFLALCCSPAWGFDFGKIVDGVSNVVDSAQKEVKKVVNSESEKTSGEKSSQSQSQQSSAPDAVVQKSGTVGKTDQPLGESLSVFSTSPIDVNAPENSVTSFNAGDHIYGLLRSKKSWKQQVGGSNYLIVWFYLDGEQKSYKSVGLQRPELLNQNYFVLDIAPDPAQMTNYSDPDVIFPEVKGDKFGPELFSRYLGELSPGKHTVRIEVKAYNKVYASGSFTVEGSDFSSYTALYNSIKNKAGQMVTMPKEGLSNPTLAAELEGILQQHGWPQIQRLIIVDKDWWIDRVDGGDTAIKSRHIAAAAAARGTDGKLFFQVLTFTQPMLLSGDWGKLDLSHSGEKKPLPEENLNK